MKCSPIGIDQGGEVMAPLLIVGITRTALVVESGTTSEPVNTNLCITGGGHVHIFCRQPSRSLRRSQVNTMLANHRQRLQPRILFRKSAVRISSNRTLRILCHIELTTRNTAADCARHLATPEHLIDLWLEPVDPKDY